ncbi:MAG: hypothetical protein ACRC57_06410 [Sarcina sp.]
MKKRKSIYILVILLLVISCALNKTYHFFSSKDILSVGEKNYKDIIELFKGENFEFNIATPNIELVSNNKISTLSEYIPSNESNSKINVLSSNSNLVISIPYAFNNTSGNIEAIEKIWVSAQPTIRYVNNNSNPQNLANDSNMESTNLNIEQTLGFQNNINTTSSGVLLSTFDFSSLDWKQVVDLNAKVNFQIKSKIYTFDLKLPEYKTTNKYNIQSNVMLDLENNDGKEYLSLGFSFLDNENSGKSFYNPLNHAIESITFNVNTTDNIELIPIKSAYMKKNNDGTYTISGPLITMENGKTGNNNLFEILKKDGTYTDQINIEVVDEVFNGLENINYIANQSNIAGSINISNSAYSKKYNIGQSAIDKAYGPSGLNGIISTYTTNLSSEMPGNYTVYSGSLIYNGQVLFVSGPDNYINRIDENSKNQYTQLNENDQNTMKHGSAIEKANLMQKIVAGDISKIYTNYEIVELSKQNKPLPFVNFVFNKGFYEGNSLNMSGTYTKIAGNQSGVNNMSSNTFTLILGDSSQSSNIELIKDGLAKGYDTTIQNKNGEYIGMFLGSSNSKSPVHRFSQADIGLADNMPYFYESTSVNIDGNMIAWQPVYTRDTNWANSEHTFNFSYTSLPVSRSEFIKKGSVLTINMGAPFVLNSDIEVNGNIIPRNSYTVEGNNILITFDKDIIHNYNSNFYDIFTMSFSATYSIFEDTTVVVGMQLGQTGCDGMEYNFNNNIESYSQHGPVWCQKKELYVKVLNTSESYCLQTIDENKDITNIVYNPNSMKNTFFVIGSIPSNEYNISDTLGFPNYGGLKFYIENFNTNNYETFVLLDKNMNDVNKAIISSIAARNDINIINQIENPKNGWMKYESGMSTDNIIAYAVKVNILPKQLIRFSYNLGIENVQSGQYQVGNTAFKYYNINTQIGANSNISTISPNENITNGTYLMTAQNNMGQKVDIPALIGYGKCKVGNEKTPEVLLEKIKWVNGENIQGLKPFEDYGYSLSSIKVNDNIRNIEWFENNGIANNEGITHIVFKLLRNINFNISVTGENNEYNSLNVNGTLKTGDDYPIKKIQALIELLENLPNSKKIIKLVWNGTDYMNDINSFISKLKNLENEKINDVSSSENIDIVIKNINSISSELITTNGKILANQKIIASGYAGEKIFLKKEVIPTGYVLESVSINGKTISNIVNNNIEYNLPKNIGNENELIKYAVKENPVTINIIFKDGNLQIGNKIIKEGFLDQVVDLENIYIPKGYKVLYVTLDGKKISKLPNSFSKINEEIIYHITRDIVDSPKVIKKENEPKIHKANTSSVKKDSNKTKQQDKKNKINKKYIAPKKNEKNNNNTNNKINGDRKNNNTKKHEVNNTNNSKSEKTKTTDKVNTIKNNINTKNIKKDNQTNNSDINKQNNDNIGILPDTGISGVKYSILDEKKVFLISLLGVIIYIIYKITYK